MSPATAWIRMFGERRRVAGDDQAVRFRHRCQVRYLSQGLAGLRGPETQRQDAEGRQEIAQSQQLQVGDGDEEAVLAQGGDRALSEAETGQTATPAIEGRRGDRLALSGKPLKTSRSERRASACRRKLEGWSVAGAEPVGTVSGHRRERSSGEGGPRRPRHDASARSAHAGTRRKLSTTSGGRCA